MPLSSIRVVDLTRILAGPFCTQLLADMGAEVIKIEAATGDPIRKQGALREGFSWYFALFNRNKKSVVLDLYCDAGKDALADLIRGADVLVENYRPGVLDRMGFGAERLRELNPRLVVGSVSGYGSTGPYAGRPSFDFIGQAMSGFMSLNGEPDGPPLRSGPPMGDLVAGLYTAFGVVCALVSRGATGDGHGQQVEASIMGGLMSLFAYMGSNYLATGEVPRRTGNDHPIVAPYGLFRAADGDIAVAPSNDVYVGRFLGAIGLEHLLDDPDFSTNAHRVRHREQLNALIDERTSSASVEHWIEVINAAGCPCGRVMGLDEVFDDAQVQSQEMVIDVPHPGRGDVRMTGFPVKLSATPCRIRRAAPELGEHTEEVLRALGYDDEKIAGVRANVAR